MHEGLRQYVASEVRAEMARQRVSQWKLGEHLGLPQPSISRRLKGEDLTFDLAELEKVAEFLGVPVTNFLPTAPRTAVETADAA